MYYLDFRFVIIKKGGDCGSKASKLILMMPKTQVKNQDSSKFQESKSHSIKNQDSSEDSREDSRYARTTRSSSYPSWPPSLWWPRGGVGSKTLSPFYFLFMNIRIVSTTLCLELPLTRNGS